MGCVISWASSVARLLRRDHLPSNQSNNQNRSWHFWASAIAMGCNTIFIKMRDLVSLLPSSSSHIPGLPSTAQRSSAPIKSTQSFLQLLNGHLLWSKARQVTVRSHQNPQTCQIKSTLGNRNKTPKSTDLPAVDISPIFSSFFSTRISSTSLMPIQFSLFFSLLA